MSVCTQDGGVRDQLNPTYFRERFALGGASRFGGFLSLIALATPCSINTSPLQEGHARRELVITVCMHV